MERGLPAPAVEPLSGYRTVNIALDAVKAHWDTLRDNVPEVLLNKRLSRLISIESNQLEHVFELGGDSVSRLVRAGFFVAAIEKVQEGSPIRRKEEIVKVLKDYHLALGVWERNWAESRSLDERMIKEVHHRLLRATRIRQDEDYNVLMIPTRAWRQSVALNNQRIATIYHRPTEIPASMSRFLSLVDPLVSAASSGELDDPYSVAAWIHHSLACIHPFQDGNGRVTRIVASIPLVLCGLPPINIFYEDGIKYGQLLRQADSQRDIGPLATFLHDQALKTASRLLAICDADVDPDGDVDGGLDTVSVAEYEKALATGPVSLPR
ncbi:hypothetical protein EXIGLDRAFT_721042 [Exidia glandulosa HHB12029]|uniref:Fido domain-containing protein n=1 Tax=Exidia glandulosa HHB12029 TaxID=1314781 RepID=A0A165G0G2_EXIGL|nr:hypothetical protein EXIGLDRAFT_721042 [Exidia glandulosa HHB12029]